jgi:predicted O-methyltransferase YrrM
MLTMYTIFDRALNELAFQLHQLSQRVNYFIYNRQFSRTDYSKFGEIPTWTKKRELETLYYMASILPRGAFALEIGSYLGASTCYLASGLSRIGGHLFCVDTWKNETMLEGGRDTFAEFLKNTQSLREHITPIRTRSSELKVEDIQLPLHLVFIDGDHNYSGVKSDFERVAPWVAKDGIIAFHDSNVRHYEGVSRVIGEALLSGQWRVGGVVESLLWLNTFN